MIHRDLVSVEKVSRETVDIKCAHGDVVSYPLAEVSMKVGDQPFTGGCFGSVACSSACGTRGP